MSLCGVSVACEQYPVYWQSFYSAADVVMEITHEDKENMVSIWLPTEINFYDSSRLFFFPTIANWFRLTVGGYWDAHGCWHSPRSLEEPDRLQIQSFFYRWRWSTSVWLLALVSIVNMLPELVSLIAEPYLGWGDCIVCFDGWLIACLYSFIKFAGLMVCL